MLHALALLALLQADPKAPTTTHVTNADFQAALKVAVANGTIDLPIRTVDVGGYNVLVAVVNMAKVTGGFTLHDKVTEMYHVISGSGTHVSGGTLVDPVKSDAGGVAGPGSRGAAIKGGVTRKVGPGDIIIIPPGVPHAWTEVPSPIVYLDIRIDPDQVLKLK
jgi:mannose-6-phosphate isomerase-like protein (cupin superfamily)